MKSENHLVQIVNLTWDASDHEDIQKARDTIAKYVLAEWTVFEANPSAGTTTVSREVEYA
jgi:hypothetical protein